MTARHAVRLVDAADPADTAPLTLTAAVRVDDLRLSDPAGLPADPPLLAVAAWAVGRILLGALLLAAAAGIVAAVVSTVPYAAIGIALVLSGVVPVPVTLLAIAAICVASPLAVHAWGRWRG